MPETGIAEAIAKLRRQNLELETSHLVDQAEQLLDIGRHIEARALVEKAEALAASPARAGAADSVEQMASQIATELSDVLTRILRELQRYSGEQARLVVRAIEERTAAMEGELRRFADLPNRLDETASSHAARLGTIDDRCALLFEGLANLQQADRERGTRLNAVAESTQELAANITRQMEALAGRVSGHDEQVQTLDRSTRELAAKIDGFHERADRLTGMVQRLQERHAHRAAVLSEVLGNIARLREQAAGEIEPTAGAETAPVPESHSSVL